MVGVVDSRASGNGQTIAIGAVSKRDHRSQPCRECGDRGGDSRGKFPAAISVATALSVAETGLESILSVAEEVQASAVSVLGGLRFSQNGSEREIDPGLGDGPAD